MSEKRDTHEAVWGKLVSARNIASALNVQQMKIHLTIGEFDYLLGLLHSAAKQEPR